MKNLGKFFALAALGFFAVSCQNNSGEAVEAKEAEEVSTPEETSATYVLNTEGDEIRWEGFKTYSDGRHVGTLQVTEGELITDNSEIVGGKFVIDMNSIYNEDLAENEDKHGKLTGHLKSADFFDVENHPTATFTVTSVTKAENAESGATHMISGNLKMRDQEKNITFPAMIDMNDNSIAVKTPEFTIDRTNWNVMYNSKNLESVAKDNLIDNNIKLKLDLTAEKQA